MMIASRSLGSTPASCRARTAARCAMSALPLPSSRTRRSLIQRVIGGYRPHDDRVQIFGVDAGVVQGSHCGAMRHVGVALAFFEDTPLLDPGPRGDPFIAGVDQPLKRGIGDDARGQLRAGAENHAAPMGLSHSGLLKMIHALVPPKPKELESATLISAWRALFGT